MTQPRRPPQRADPPTRPRTSVPVGAPTWTVIAFVIVYLLVVAAVLVTIGVMA